MGALKAIRWPKLTKFGFSPEAVANSCYAARAVVNEAAFPKTMPAKWGRRAASLALLVVVTVVAVWLVRAHSSFPSDQTPEGAYLRVVIAVNRGRAEDFFAYTETRAQHAAYTIRDFRRRARERVLAAYPEPERGRLSRAYAAEADAPDGADIFALYAKRYGWTARLRHDLSGVKRVDTSGDRATIETARGTRYPFRRRENGIWGLTQFTPLLDAEAERAARDFSVIDKAAADYARAARASSAPSSSAPKSP